jgi:hypothetical protein
VSKILRTEEWTFEDGPMLRTGVVNVFEGEVCHVVDDILTGMEIDPEEYPEEVEFETFYRRIPYETFKEGILNAGGSYAGTS